jgi:hypothetical protein
MRFRKENNKKTNRKKIEKNMIYEYQLQKTLREIERLKAELAKYESRQTADRLTLCSSESGQATEYRLDNPMEQGSDILSGK